MLYHHSSVGLSLSPQTGIGLLVQFQRPCQPKPDESGASGLKIQTRDQRMPGESRPLDFTVIPVLDILTGLQLPDSKTLFDAL